MQLNQLTPIKLSRGGTNHVKPGCSLIQPEMMIAAIEHKFNEGTYNFNPTLNLGATATKLAVPDLNFAINYSKQFQRTHEQFEDINVQTTSTTSTDCGHYCQQIW